MVGSKLVQIIRQFGRHYKRVLTRRAMPSVQQAPEEAGDNANKAITSILLSQQELSHAQQLFQELDTNGDGYLDMDELAQGLRKFELPTSHGYLETLFRQIDTNGNGLIDLKEFTVFIECRKQKLERAYHWILEQQQQQQQDDTNKAKGITAGTLRAAAQTSGVTLSDADITKIMKRWDQNGDEQVSFEEFLHCLLLAPEFNPKSFLDRWYIDAFTDDAQSEFTLPREIRVLPKTEDDQAQQSFAQQVSKKLCLGGLSGCLSRTLTAPIDRIRILMMTSVERIGVRGALQLGTSGGGILRLWQGNGANCLKISPEMAVKLFTFDALKHHIAADPDNVTVQERFVAGGLAGVTSQVSIYPMEVVKTQLAVSKTNNVGVMDCLKQTIARGGYRALYAGLGPSVVGIIPYAAIDLSLNSVLKDIAAAQLEQQHQEANVPVLLGCGMISSGTATVVTFPLNVIRTKAQATGDSFGMVLKSLRGQGLGAFYRGMIPCLAKVLPATSISYAAYEYLGESWDKKMMNSNGGGGNS